jgi:DNA invertase Pin-like site-specific DNA recombinase
MANTLPIRVAIYARVSTDNTGQDPESQLMQLRAWCAEIRHVVVGQYIDYESDGAERWPGRARLMKSAARQQFDMVLVWSLDIFHAKGVGETAIDIRRLLQHGVAFHSFTEAHLCTDDPQAHQALFSVIHAFANLKEQQTSRRIKAGLRRARAKGKRLGRAPFSYEQLQKLQAALDTGANWHQVSRMTGIPYSTAKKWAHELGREPPGRGVTGHGVRSPDQDRARVFKDAAAQHGGH